MFDRDIFGGDHRESPDEVVKWGAFEDAVRRVLASEFHGGNFTPADIRQRDTFVIDGAKLAPDFVVFDGGRVLCVADAKDHAVLSAGDARDVARYAAFKPAEPPRIYVPERCHIQPGALEVEATGAVIIVVLKL